MNILSTAFSSAFSFFSGFFESVLVVRCFAESIRRAVDAALRLRTEGRVVESDKASPLRAVPITAVVL